MGRSRSRSGGRGGRGGGDEDRIQKLVDERQQCRRDRDFDKADQIREELRDMGVQVDDGALSWRGPGGMEGNVNNGGGRGGGGGGGGFGGGGGIERRDGDWDCPRCGKMVFASKTECFACGEPKPSSSGGRGGGGRGGDRYDDDRRGGDRGGGRSRHDDDDRHDRGRRRRSPSDDYDRRRRR